MTPWILSSGALAVAAATLFRVWRAIKVAEAFLDRIQVRDPYGSCSNAGDEP